MELLVHSPEHRHGGANGSFVLFETTDDLPTLGVVQIAAPGTDTSKAKVGDLVTLSFTASEALQQSPTCTFKSGGASVSGSADNDAATWSGAQSTDNDAATWACISSS